MDDYCPKCCLIVAPYARLENGQTDRVQVGKSVYHRSCYLKLLAKAYACMASTATSASAS